MWPWTHLASGYLLVSLLWRLGDRRVDGPTALAVAVGTQFPDLVDKPLAWSVALLPAGRSLSHSLLTAAVVTAVVVAVAVRRDRQAPALAFAVGYGSHLVGDALPSLLAGDPDGLTFLLWPLLPLPEYGGAAPTVGRLSEILATPASYVLASPVRLLVFLAVVAIWGADGRPGVAVVVRCLRRWAGRSVD